MVKDYEFIEHTADVGLKVVGKTKRGLFLNAARGMFFLISGATKISRNHKNQRTWKVECKSYDIEDLLVSWLSDLLYIHHHEFVILEDFNIYLLVKSFIRSEAIGIKIEESAYQIEKEIKAVTYHRLHIERNNLGLWETNIFFDT